MQPVIRGEPFFISTYLFLSRGIQFKSHNSNRLMLHNEDHSNGPHANGRPFETGK